MAKHKLTVTYDDATGAVTAAHRCVVVVADQTISHAENVALGPGAAASLKVVVDANRAEMERRTTAMALQHAAAVAGKQPAAGTKAIVAGGTLGALGAAKPK